MSSPGQSLLMAALAAALVAAGPLAREEPPGPRGHEPAEAAVWVTTDRGAVRGCALLAAPARRADDGLDALRRVAVRLGADVLLLRSLSEGSIDADLYRCAPFPATPAAPPTAATPASSPIPALPVPRAVAAPLPAPTAAPAAAASSESAVSASPATERQRRARAELEGLKAALRVVEDPALVASCEKRGEGRGDEDTLRGDAVTANANVLLRIRSADSPVTAEYFRCSEPFRTLRATPRPPGRAPTPRPGG